MEIGSGLVAGSDQNLTHPMHALRCVPHMHLWRKRGRMPGWRRQALVHSSRPLYVLRELAFHNYTRMRKMRRRNAPRTMLLDICHMSGICIFSLHETVGRTVDGVEINATCYDLGNQPHY
jgi:hypothetical protein